tara:strand:+ start:98 stop:862 length:765 start_codon:yes stop_codon:yes gene_type:complete
MFFILSKVLLFLLSPFTWLLISLTMYLCLKNKIWKKRFMWSTLVIFFFFSNGFIVNRLVSLWEIDGVKYTELNNHENGIVLSGMFEYNKDLDRLSARRGSDRIWQAIQLYRKNKIKKIIITGDTGYVLKKGLHEASQLKEDLIAMGIPEKDLLIETESRNTHENAHNTKLLIEQLGLSKKSNVLITSSTHMRRAKACFTKEGLNCTAYTTDHYNIHANPISLLEFIPSHNAFIMWDKLIKEWVGYAMYSMMGYL